MVRIKIMSAGERDDPHASCDASRSPPDAPASPRAEPLDSPGRSPLSAAAAARPRRPPRRRPGGTPRLARRAPPTIPPAEPPGAPPRAPPGAPGQAATSPPRPPPCARPPSASRWCARCRPSSRRRRRRRSRRRARRAFAASRDARRERARRESADARFDALSRLYVAKFKEDTDTSVIDTDARAVSCPAPRVPGPGPARDGNDDFSRAEKNFLFLASERRERSRRRWYTTTSTPCSARRVSLFSARTSSPRLVMRKTDCVLRRNAVPPTTRRATRLKTSSLKNENDGVKKTSLDAETKTTPKTTVVKYTTTYARLGSRSDTVTNYGDPANARGPDDSDLLPGWSFTGVTKDTKFRKRCPMHEGPCADCGARCRVPFRPTRGAARGRDDPLCARCLVARKEHRKAATERDWKERREGTRA